MKHNGEKSVFELHVQAQAIGLLNSKYKFKTDVDKLQKQIGLIEENYKLKIEDQLKSYEAAKEWFEDNKETIEQAKDDIQKLRNYEGTVRYGLEYQAQYDMAAKIFIGKKSKSGSFFS